MPLSTTSWGHGFRAHFPTAPIPAIEVPNDLTTLGIQRALELWAGEAVAPWDEIVLLDSTDAIVAQKATTNTVGGSELSCVADFADTDITAETATVEIRAGGVVVATAPLTVPSGTAVVVTRKDTLVEAS